jgi:hypothetical protein
MYKIFDDVFNSEEISFIINKINELEFAGQGKIYRETGRKLIGLKELDKSIINKVELYIQDFYKKNLSVADIGFMRFKKEYGKPKLLPHKDDYACEVVFDYQLRTNKKWDLFIEGKRVELKDNQAVSFEGESEAHWREKTVFDDSEYVEMICFNCIGDNHWRHKTTVNPVSEIEQAKNKKMVFSQWAKKYSN